MALTLDTAFVRQVLLPGLSLVPGRALMCRVMAAEGGRGTLAIAGFTVDARLPPELRPGQELRLVIREVDAHRVLFAIADREAGLTSAGTAPAAGPATASTGTPGSPGSPGSEAPPAAVPGITLPGGATLRVREDEDGGRGGGDPARPRSSLMLRFEGEGIGAVDLRLTLDPARLEVTVALDAGAPLTRGTAAAPALRAALGSGAERAVSVAVVPRRRPLDLYA